MSGFPPSDVPQNTPGISPAAFDSRAAGYDQVANSDLGLLYRGRVRSIVAPLLKPGSRVMDIGCGTGLDASWLAELGHDVVAIDSSPAMVSETKARVPATIDVQLQDIDALDQSDLGQPPFDLIVANFGAINCIKDLPRFGRWLTGGALQPGGSVVLVTMAGVCPPEIVQAGLTGNRSLLSRRRGGRSHPGYEGVQVRYWSARALVEQLGQPELALQHAVALGTVLPTFEQRQIVQARPRLRTVLDAADRLVERPAARFGLGDHQVAVLMRAGR